MRKSDNISVTFIALCLCASTYAWGQRVKPPRAKTPLALADFETPEAVAAWTGLKCERTDAHASAGKFAMRFTIPKWEEGMSRWPLVSLTYDSAAAFPKDWSHYGQVAFDTWIEGDEPGDIALELRDKKGQNGYSTHLIIEPGKKNSFALPLDDVATQINISNVEEIIFYTSTPPRTYTVTVDNLRLLPGERPPLAEFDLVYPNYRQMIFPDANHIQVAVSVDVEEYELQKERLTLSLSAHAGRKHISAKSLLQQGRGLISIPVDKLPPGPVALSAHVIRKADAATLTSHDWQLRKLTTAELKSLKVYIDQHNNTVVEGKPFFPLGWYDSPNMQHLSEIADSPFNCILDYGTNSQSKEYMLKYLDAMQQKGLKLIYCMNDVYPTARYYEGKAWEGVKGNDAIAAAVVQAYRDHPAILAWYLNDELPRSLVPKLEDYYHRVRQGDPNHPCYIVLCDMPEVKYFPDTTDVMGVDPYPIPSGPVTRVSEEMDCANTAVHGHKPTWLVPQAFAWYQYNSTNPDRGHVPTAEELKSGRAPTYQEERCMTFLALVRGAKGLIYYCYYDLRVLPQYQDMWKWMKEIGAQVKALSPVLLSPEDLGSVHFIPANAAIHTKLKRCDGRLYLIAVNADTSPHRVTFNLRHKLPKQVKVMFENRMENTDGDKLTADFKPLEVHVYDLERGGK